MAVQGEGITPFKVETDPEEGTPISGATTILNGAVFPESTHLEPTIGQIWPR